MKRLLSLLGCVAMAACQDPVRERLLDELGDEDPAVPVGPLHRPGQPCLACHGPEGDAEPRFSFGGTVYQTPGSLEPLHDARVRFIDSNGEQYAVTSNCAGNFYSGADNFKPAWPVWMKVEFGEWTAEMVSPSSREGSCAACHGDPASPSSVGHVYLVEDDAGFTQERCE